jgi:hypothetical protein
MEVWALLHVQNATWAVPYGVALIVLINGLSVSYAAEILIK